MHISTCVEQRERSQVSNIWKSKKRPIYLEKAGAVFKVFIGSCREHYNYRIRVWTEDSVLSCTTKTIIF